MYIWYLTQVYDINRLCGEYYYQARETRKLLFTFIIGWNIIKDYWNDCHLLSFFLVWNTGFPTRGEASDTIVRIWIVCFLLAEFLVGKNLCLYLFTHLINHQNTQLNDRTKIKRQIVLFLKFWVVFTDSSFLGNPYVKVIFKLF